MTSSTPACKAVPERDVESDKVEKFTTTEQVVEAKVIEQECPCRRNRGRKVVMLLALLGVLALLHELFCRGGRDAASIAHFLRGQKKNCNHNVR